MKEAYFIFNDKKSSDLGIAITFENLPPIQLAEEDVEVIEVPGRDGYLTRGNDRRVQINKTITCQLLKNEHKEEVKRWLRGRGKLTLSNEDDVFFNAVILNPVSFYWNVFGGYNFDVEFTCQPNAYLHQGQSRLDITDNNTKLYNPGSVTSEPYIKIYGSGNVDLTINNSTSKYNINDYVEIDSELMECYKNNSLQSFKGEFPLLIPGGNNISWNGNVSKIEIIPRWCR